MTHKPGDTVDTHMESTTDYGNTLAISKKNHGTVDTKSDGGMIIREAYGKDDSDVTMSAAKERGGRMGGSTTNIPGVTGASVKQHTSYSRER